MEADQTYLLEIAQIQYLDNLRGGKEAYVVEFKIIESSSETQRPGQTVSFFQPTAGSACPEETAAGAIKAFLAAALHVHPDELDVKDMRDSFDESQTLTGTLVRCETVSGVTKERKTSFTYHNWAVYEGTNE
jgi:hypothetical protein